jgi:hypothetical protein
MEPCYLFFETGTFLSFMTTWSTIFKQMLTRGTLPNFMMTWNFENISDIDRYYILRIQIHIVFLSQTGFSDRIWLQTIDDVSNSGIHYIWILEIQL